MFSLLARITSYTYGNNTDYFISNHKAFCIHVCSSQAVHSYRRPCGRELDIEIDWSNSLSGIGYFSSSPIKTN
jgi:hypothetical protein